MVGRVRRDVADDRRGEATRRGGSPCDHTKYNDNDNNNESDNIMRDR